MLMTGAFVVSVLSFFLSVLVDSSVLEPTYSDADLLELISEIDDSLKPDTVFFVFSDNKQTGLMNLIDVPVTMQEYENALNAYVDMIEAYKIPVIVATSAQSSPNGPISPIYKSALDAALQPQGLVECVNYFPRTGVIDIAKHLPALRQMLTYRDMGRNQVVLNGIVMEVCVLFPALTLKNLGFDVYVAVDASGTTLSVANDAALTRMVQAGIKLTTWFDVACSLQGDWLNPNPTVPPTTPDPFQPLLNIVLKHYVKYEMLTLSQCTSCIDPDESCPAVI